MQIISSFLLTFLPQFLVLQSLRERDELLVALRAVRASQQEAQQREWSACLQVKQAVEMAEEAHLYKARVRETYAHIFPSVLAYSHLDFTFYIPIAAGLDNLLYLFVCMQVEVQCEQLSRELARQREHVEREAKVLKERLAEAREEGRAEARKQKEELAHTVILTFSLFNSRKLLYMYCMCSSGWFKILNISLIIYKCTNMKSTLVYV